MNENKETLTSHVNHGIECGDWWFENDPQSKIEMVKPPISPVSELIKLPFDGDLMQPGTKDLIYLYEL